MNLREFEFSARGRRHKQGFQLDVSTCLNSALSQLSLILQAYLGTRHCQLWLPVEVAERHLPNNHHIPALKSNPTGWINGLR